MAAAAFSLALALMIEDMQRQTAAGVRRQL
jgi:hypothetical protein